MSGTGIIGSGVSRPAATVVNRVVSGATGASSTANGTHTPTAPVNGQPAWSNGAWFIYFSTAVSSYVVSTSLASLSSSWLKASAPTVSTGTYNPFIGVTGTLTVT